jgi:16S rRNA processing protein rimM
MGKFVKIGKITKPHGVHGTLKVLPLTDDQTRYNKLKKIYIQTRHGMKEFDIIAVRYKDKFVLLDLVGIETMTEAENYIGNYIVIDKKDRMPLHENTYYIEDLIGLSVYEGDTYLGKLTDVMQPGSNDVYIITLEDGKELLLPAIKSVILEVNIESGLMKVTVPEGLR